MRSAAAGVCVFVLLCAVNLAGCQYLFPSKSLLQEARDLETAGKYAKAAAAYEKFFRRNPAGEEALEALSRAAVINEELLGDWRKAAGLLQELRLKSKDRPQYPQVMLRLGRVLERSGSPYSEAIAVYGALCGESVSSPEGISASVALGRIYESLKVWSEAKTSYQLAIQRLGGPDRARDEDGRMQNVWLLEALDAYFSGKIEEAVRLARQGLAELTIPAVRQGLEDLLRRYGKAQKFWNASAGLVVLEDSEAVDEIDRERFMITARGGTGFLDLAGGSRGTPDGYRIEYNDKRQSFVLYEEAKSGKEERKNGAKQEPWIYESPSRILVLGFWWSPDGTKLGWIGKWRGGKSMRIDIVDLKKKSAHRAIYDPSGTILGRVMLFLPRCEKMVFPYRDYLAVADLDGGNQTIFRLRSGGKVAYRSAEADSLACSADGLDVAVGVRSGQAFWKLSLAAGGM